jgi:DNA topoisomerase-1
VIDPAAFEVVSALKRRRGGGDELLAYRDAKGKWCDIKSPDIRAYIKATAGEDYTAKDFRTWSGTLLAALELQALRDCASEAEARKNVAQAIASVAQRLGNTPAVCRKCYVHPAVLDCSLLGAMHETWDALLKSVKAADDPHALKLEEMAVLALLQARREAA